MGNKVNRRVDKDMYNDALFRKFLEDNEISRADLVKITGFSDHTIRRCLNPSETDVIKESTLKLVVLASGGDYTTFVNEENKERKNAQPKTQIMPDTTENIDFKPLLDKLDVLIYSEHKDLGETKELLNQLSIDIHTLGNIQMQTMEYVKDIMNSMAEIKGCVRQIKSKN